MWQDSFHDSEKGAISDPDSKLYGKCMSVPITEFNPTD